MSSPSNSPDVSAQRVAWWRKFRFPEKAFLLELVLLLGFAVYFLGYGLLPLLGGDRIGLVGADEPRYAQVAREMLIRHDYVTPILYGLPWLEKPALFYWRAMFAFEEFGVHDWAARLPSTSFAFALVLLIFLHMRRFRPGGQIFAALITVSCAAIIGFSRGASTDMQMAAPVCIGLLGWYAWYETGSKFWLFDIYFFVAVGTLAKGPIAPAIAFATIITFALLRREWSIIRRGFWWPGMLLYVFLVLPWFIAVQKRNPDFLRVFFLQHNLERFATDRFHHHQPLWFYLPVLLIGLIPWTALALAAFVDAIRGAVEEWRVRRYAHRYLWMPRTGDAFPEFLVLWALIPLVFFTFSGSKLPGYVLPSIPAITVLTGDYLNRMRNRGLPHWLMAAHGVFVGGVTTAILLLPRYIASGEQLPAGEPLHKAVILGLLVAVALLVVAWRFRPGRLHAATMVPTVLLLFFLLHNNGQLIDNIYSARPLAHEIQALTLTNPLAQTASVAVFSTRRDIEYGVAFYRNQRVINYRNDGVPLVAHLLITRTGTMEEAKKSLDSRPTVFLMHDQAQDLDVYWVGAAKSL